ncbi:Zinc/iron permease [Syncephalastrum racemosum]|uniref:Zinc/iron permease n=1 Tax=Syncephalastrum racemosum TaxID=13706 RepID=A0A1X2HRE2_SYNRA|nr:Zinc/iron permease [Syncephalastrum racemosum]
MVNPFLWLLLLCITMLVGSFVAGCIPLSTKLSETKLRYLTALGVGLLIGTALVVIIPEGIETLYSATREAHEQQHSVSPSLLAPVSPPPLPVHTTPALEHVHSSLDSALAKRQAADHDDHSDGLISEHAAIGLALIIGFAVMFLVDQVSSLHMHSSHKNNSNGEYEYNELHTVPQPANENDEPVHRIRSPAARSMTPTIGLIVHAAADGIALGASASHPKLSMVVFLAIMLHKAPSAFALTTVLLAEGLSRISVRRHLLMFSLSAPSGAILTYLLLFVFSSPSTTTSAASSTHLAYWTGILLVFSGGTFLYVAMHALQELQPASTSPSSALAHPEKMSRSQILTILAGMFLPVILNIGHSH